MLYKTFSRLDVSYFYIEDEEIGSFEKGRIKELKVLGLANPIAIEIEGKPYVPIIDPQHTIRQLVDWETGIIAFQNNCDAFGNGITGNIPYAYMGKRYDVSTGLYYFGKRYYDPNLGRWLSQDPLGPVDHSNLYQYVFNNPYLFQDPTGENILGFLCGIGQILLGGTIIASGAFLEIATFGGYTFALGFHEAAGLSLMTLGCATVIYNAQDISFTEKSSKIYDFDLIYKTDDNPKSSDEPGSPPYRGDKLGKDPTKSPSKGFKWKGTPGSREGSGSKDQKECKTSYILI